MIIQYPVNERHYPVDEANLYPDHPEFYDYITEEDEYFDNLYNDIQETFGDQD
jgi:hypothetical protein